MHGEKDCQRDIGLVMRTWKMEVGGHRKIGKPKLRWSGDVIRKVKRHEGETSKQNKHNTGERGQLKGRRRRRSI